MPRISVPISGLDSDYRSQLEYALSFAAEEITSYRIDDLNSTVEADIAATADCEAVGRKIRELVERYEKRELGLARAVEFQQQRELPVFDAWSALLERRWVTPVGLGHVILRGPAAQLMSLVNARIERTFVKNFRPELEIYPATIRATTLDRCNHFTSFPEHIDFVAHLKSDVDVLTRFSEDCRQHGWSEARHEGRMAGSDFAISPSCCYHCYEGMEGWSVEAPGRCITVTVGCHRFEGANHKSMSRLRAFTMREIVWVGQPRFVIEARARAEELITQWARDWELVGTFETANDMFFTQDYAVKASFQRQQQAKKELKLLIPSENQSISVFSSNFHAMTFGKAFNISVGGRPATSGCLGWGFERWVYAIFSQFGLEVDRWPAGLRAEFEQHVATGSQAPG